MPGTATNSTAKVIVTRKMPDAVQANMRRLFNVDLNETDEAFSREKLIHALQTADILVPTITDNLSREVLEMAGPQLKLIASFGAGVNHIDVKAATERGILVTNTPGVLSEDTADMTLALILGVMRRIGEGQHAIEKGEWPGWSPSYMMGTSLSGKNLGILGMGRIGLAVARRARGFGLKIHYHNRRAVDEAIADELEATYWPELDEMLPEMDVISVHAPLTPETHHMLDARRIDMLKPHSYVINTARGELIDEAALAKALTDNRIAGVGLDVFEREPEVTASLINNPRAFLMPHLGSATVETRVGMGERVIINVRAFLDGHTPPDRVLP